MIADPPTFHWYEYVIPAGALGPTKLTLPPVQNVVVPIVVIVAVGNAFTVTTAVVLLIQPPTVTV